MCVCVRVVSMPPVCRLMHILMWSAYINASVLPHSKTCECVCVAQVCLVQATEVLSFTIVETRKTIIKTTANP